MRLDSRDYRFLAVCLALLAATVWFSASYYHRAFPEASIDFRVTRGQAGGIARGFLGQLGYKASGYREAARFGYDEDAKTFLERELGLEQANRVVGTSVRLWRWSYRWFKPQQKEEFRVDVTPRGEPVGFEHRIPEGAARPSLSAAQARAAAEAFLASRMHRDPATLEFVEGSSLARPARTDHVFTWKQRGFDIHDATYRFEVTVLGSEIGGYKEYLKVPETWLRAYERLRSKNTAAASVDTALMLLLVVGMLAALVVRIRNHDVRWRRAAIVGLTGGGLLFLSSLNSFSLSEFSYPTTDSYASFLARQLVNYVLGALAAAGFLFVLTAGAEPEYREHFGRFISLGNLFGRGLRTKSFFKGSVLGLALTGIFVAYQIAFYMTAYRFGAWSPADVPYDDLLNTTFPWLFVLFGGFFPAVSEEFLFRMFAIPWLRKVTRSIAAAIVLAGFIWGFGHAGYPQQPFYIRGVEVGIGGVALGLVMLRWGILPTLVWHYSVDALYTALLLLRSHNPYFVLSGAITAGIMVLPALLAWIAYRRTGHFVPEDEFTNAAEGVARPMAEAEPAASAPAAAYQPWLLRRRIAALALLIAGAAAYAVPVQKFGERPRFALTADRARAAANEFLAQRGIAPQSFSNVVYPVNRWSEDESWGLPLVAQYFLQRRPIGVVTESLNAYSPLQFWAVRYYRPLDKEEVRVAVNPETGAITGFRHTLPEDRPGAMLAPEAARELAAAFLAGRRMDLHALELKETSAEDRKARRDYTLVWEAKPGDPRNVEEARFRVRVRVAGDRVASLACFWKLPEPFIRERESRNALSLTLSILRVAVAASTMVWAILLLVRFTRKRALRWRTALLAAIPIALLVLVSSLLELPSAMRGYQTAIPVETFRIVLIVGLVIAAVGALLASACACALLSVLRPRSAWTRMAAVDGLFATAAALGLAALASQAAWYLRNWFHSQALLSPPSPGALGSLFPAGSVYAGAVQQTVFALAGVALVAALVGWLRKYRPLLPALAAVVIAGMATGGVHTGGEFLLAFALGSLATAAAIAFAFIARANELAWVFGIFSLIAVPAAFWLLDQPAYDPQGWMALGLAGLSMLAIVWRTRNA